MAKQKLTQTDYYYGLLMEGRMDMMHLPSGAVAWLWQYSRPQAQVDSASQFAATAYSLGDQVMDAALLRADKNILVLHLQSGNRISVYPDGGLGSNGEPIDNTPEAFHAFISGDTAGPEIGPMMGMPADIDLDMGPIGII